MKHPAQWWAAERRDRRNAWLFVLAVLVAVAAASAAHADFGTDLELQQLRDQQQFQWEMQRVNAVGARMQRGAQCYLKADREWRKIPASRRAHLSEAEHMQLSRDIINECCLEHDCDGAQ